MKKNLVVLGVIVVMFVVLVVLIRQVPSKQIETTVIAEEQSMNQNESAAAVAVEESMNQNEPAAEVNNSENKEDKVVARIGEQEIKSSVIDQLILQMSEEGRKALETPEAKADFIRDYVATEVLHGKAIELGFDKTPEMQNAIEVFKKQLSIEYLLRSTIQQNLNVTEEEVKNFYEQNKERYNDPEAIKISYVEMNDEAGKEQAVGMLQNAGGTKLDQWLTKGQEFYADNEEANNAIAALFNGDKGTQSDLIKINNSYFIFSLDEKRLQVERTYEEVKARVEYEYRLLKQQEITKSLLSQLFTEKKVEVY